MQSNLSLPVIDRAAEGAGRAPHAKSMSMSPQTFKTEIPVSLMRLVSLSYLWLFQNIFCLQSQTKTDRQKVINVLEHWWQLGGVRGAAVWRGVRFLLWFWPWCLIWYFFLLFFLFSSGLYTKMCWSVRNRVFMHFFLLSLIFQIITGRSWISDNCTKCSDERHRTSAFSFVFPRLISAVLMNGIAS